MSPNNENNPDHLSVPIVAAAALDDLADRLNRRRTRPGAAAPIGISPERIGRLVDVWTDRFDWRAVEAEQDALGAAITTTRDGRRLQYVHAAAASSSLPVLLLHGWPDTPLQFRHLIPRLRDAGITSVAPSAAGFGYSDEPEGELSPGLVAGDVHGLMVELGFERYVVHGTDWGATIAAALVEAFPEAVAGLHLLQPPFDRSFLVDRSTASDTETTYLTHMDRWNETAAYVSVHMHQADTLAAALDDSPVGLLAWLAEKYDAWSGPNLADDDIVAATSTMWFTGTLRSSVRLYSEPAASWNSGEWSDDSWGAETADGDVDSEADAPGAWDPRLDVPTAFAVFPDDIGTPPREFCERFFDVQRFTVMPRGGHWAALDEPDLLADDLIAWITTLSSPSTA